MSTYKRAGYRVVALFALVFAVLSLAPSAAQATTCQQDCFNQEHTCFNFCSGNINPFGCREACIADYSSCLEGC
jgi:hypothetical protein